ncbi:MAG: hypothetical protein AAF614_26200 [Chloroflexota bacterium]
MSILSRLTTYQIFGLAVALSLLLAWLWGIPLAELAYASWLGTPFLFERLRGAGEWIVLLISALGWVAVAMTVYGSMGERRLIRQSQNKPFAALSVALLLLLNPFLPATWGTIYPWLIAIVWWSSRHIWKNGRISLPHAILLLIPFAYLILPNPLPPRPIWHSFAHFTQQNELLWLFLPLILLGLFPTVIPAKAGIHSPSNRENKNSRKGAKTQRKENLSTFAPLREIIFLLWTVLAIILGHDIAEAATAVFLITLTTLGLNHLASRWHTAAWLLLIPLLLAQGITLWQQFAARPLAIQTAEKALATRLQIVAAADTLFASAHVGVAANWPTERFIASHLDRIEPSAALAKLIATEPDLVVSNGRSLQWQTLTSTNWFKQRYRPSPKDADSPVTLWHKTETSFDYPAVQTALDVNAADKFRLRGVEMKTAVFQPADPLHITLNLAPNQPITQALTTNLHLVAAQDQQIWAWKQHNAPHSVPGGWWQAGQTIPERITIETTADLPVGGYELRAFFHDANNESRWPLFPAGADQPRDWVRLGYLLIPPNVTLPANAMPVAATFGDSAAGNTIQLTHAAITKPAAPGDPLTVELFWQASQPPELSYTVFVHLLNEAGELVSNHDSIPGNGRFPTPTWHLPTPIPDSHTLPLPNTLPASTYQLLVGLYLLETGERLPAHTANNQFIPNAAFSLGTITFP